MKNQNDLIVIIVAVFLALCSVAYFFFGKRTVMKPADPTPVNVSAAKPAEGAVSMANKLPAAKDQQGGAPASAGSRMGGGAPGGSAPSGPMKAGVQGG
ncbi:MAG: hypothetical protein JST30_05500 [Armatimonadetes bacterium]|nr:hypothetical protein [Armatimonadota bacterium]